MGLELVEIVMEIEDEFALIIPETEGSILTVGDLQKFILSNMDRTELTEALLHLPLNDIGGKIPHEIYCRFWNDHQWLPKPKRLIWKNKFKREELQSFVENKLKYIDNPELIKQKICSIIRDQLQLKDDPKPTDRFVQDLGCN